MSSLVRTCSWSTSGPGAVARTRSGDTEPARQARRATRARHGDEGAASTELVVATPLIMIMLLVVVQLAVWGWAEQVASAAARRGVDAARLAGADPQAAQTTAGLITSQIGGGVLTHPQITVTQTSPTLLTVTVTGSAIRYLPGLGLHVSARATAPREAFHP